MMKILIVLLGLLFTPSMGHASVSTSVLDSNESSPDGSNRCTTSTMTPVAGQLVLLWLVNSNSNTATVVSGTGGFSGVSWTSIRQQAGLAVLRGVPASSSSGTITWGTVELSGPNYCRWIITTHAGVNQTTSQGIVQSAQNNTSGTTITVTLGALAKTSNAVLSGAVLGTAGTGTTYTPGAGYTTVATSISNLGGGLVGNHTFGLELGGTNTPSHTFGASASPQGVAVELNNASTVKHRVLFQ